jgi:predicted lipid-binding transport protein (Tim44 family)
MSQPFFVTTESEQAETQRKTFKGIGCAAGALAFPAPFLFGFPGGFGMVPVLIVIGFVFMFLAISAKRRRDRALLAQAAANPSRQHFAPTQTQAPTYYAPPAASAPTTPPSTNSGDADAKLNQRLNKAKKAGL